MPVAIRRVLFALLLAAAVPSRTVADELPAQVRLDRYLVELNEQASWGNWERVCELYETIHRERLPPPPDFAFKYAVALVKAHRDEQALVRLKSFVSRADRDDPSYAEALKLLVDVERRLDQEREAQAAEESRRLEEQETARRQAEERARARALELQRRREFLERQVTLADSAPHVGLFAAGGGAAGILLGTLAVVAAHGASSAYVPLLFAGGTLVLAAVGTLCIPDWTSPTALVVLGAVAGGLPGVLMFLAFVPTDFVTAVGFLLASVGGAAIASGLAWEISQRRVAVDAHKALDEFRRANPGAAPSDASGPGTPPLSRLTFEF